MKFATLASTASVLLGSVAFAQELPLPEISGVPNLPLPEVSNLPKLPFPAVPLPSDSEPEEWKPEPTPVPKFYMQTSSDNFQLDKIRASYLSEDFGVYHIFFIAWNFPGHEFYLNGTSLLSNFVTDDTGAYGMRTSQGKPLELTEAVDNNWQTGYTFDENDILKFNGTDAFYACPARQSLWEAKFYVDKAPEDCVKVSLVKIPKTF